MNFIFNLNAFSWKTMHRRLLAEIHELTAAIGLSPTQVLQDWAGDSPGITANLKRIIEQLVRAEVIYHYVYIDELLSMTLMKHTFRGRKEPSRGSIPRRTHANLLSEVYPMQKLRVIRGFKKVPKKIINIIGAINDLRNTAAHQFDLALPRRSKFEYKGTNLFTADGIQALQADVMEVEKFFAPWINAIAVEFGLRPPRDSDSPN